MNESGATLIEYAIALALIAVVAMMGMLFFGQRVADQKCLTAGVVRKDDVPLRYNAREGCCGYSYTSDFGGTVFQCVD